MTNFVDSLAVLAANQCTIILDNETNKLMEATYSHTSVSIKGDIVHHFIHNNEELAIAQVDDKYSLFRNKEEFERDSHVPCTSIDFTKCDLNRSDRKHVSIHAAEEERMGYAYSYRFDEGVPVEVDAPITGFKITLRNGGYHQECVYEEGINLEEYYATREQAVLFHSYKITKNDGTEEVVPGKYSFIVPDEKQQEALKKLRDAFAEAKKAGIELVYAQYIDRIVAVNGKTSRLTYDGGDDYDPKFGLMGHKADLIPQEMRLESIFYYSDCEALNEIKKGE